MTTFHLGAAPDAATMPEEQVRQILAVLTRKQPDDETISQALQKVIDKPNEVHALSVFQLQYRP